MKNIFNLNLSLLLICALSVIIDPSYPFLGVIIQGFIQVGISIAILINKKFNKDMRILGWSHLIGSLIACVLIFSIGVHLEPMLFVLGLLMAFILFFFSIFSTYQCVSFLNDLEKETQHV